MFFFDILQIPSGCVQICSGCMNICFEFIVPLRSNCPNANLDVFASVLLLCGVSVVLPRQIPTSLQVCVCVCVCVCGI